MAKTVTKKRTVEEAANQEEVSLVSSPCKVARRTEEDKDFESSPRNISGSNFSSVSQGKDLCKTGACQKGSKKQQKRYKFESMISE